MPIPSFPLRRVIRWICFLVFVAVPITVFGIPHFRHATFQAAGQMLVTSDVIERAEVIVIAADADGAGVLEAADLVSAGIASRVAIFADPPDRVDREFLRRGVAYFNAAAISLQQLHSFGVEHVEQIPRTVEGTEDASVTLVNWCIENKIDHAVFVVNTDHSRRTRRLLDRASRGTGVNVYVRPARYSDFDPDDWWLSRGSIRIQILESQKLLWDVVRHPF